ncbi:hypothetical protein ACFL6C_14435 [Myxococcota bacterium]
MGKTDADVVKISTKTLSEHLEKLSNLANKGLHSEITKAEARRCVVRTIVLLDDILQLADAPFAVQTEIKEPD